MALIEITDSRHLPCCGWSLFSREGLVGGVCFDNDELCDLPQFVNVTACNSLYSDARSNSFSALNKLRDEQNDGTSLFNNTNINGSERAQLEAFLNALTDPCVLERDCLSPWIADQVNDNPDDNVFIAQDQFGDPL